MGSEPQVDNITSLKALLKEKMALREVAETALAGASTALGTTSVGLRGSLVDSEGFPKEDVDVHAVRIARNTVACSSNDLKVLTDEIADLLGRLHAAAAVERSNAAASAPAPVPAASAAPATTTESNDVAEATPEPASSAAAAAAAPAVAVEEQTHVPQGLVRFIVDNVVSGGPADLAGLKGEDRVLSFGDVTTAQLSDVGALVRRSEGAIVSVSVWRPAEAGSAAAADGLGVLKVVPLVPMRWAGNGLLGCVLRTDV